MSNEEYKNRLMKIRVEVNTFLDDLGVKYSEAPEMLEKVLNVAMNGDFCDEKNGKIKTAKIISVSNYRAPEHFKVKAVYM